MPSVKGDGRNGPDQEPKRLWSQPIDENRTEETLTGWDQENSENVEKWYEATEEEERQQGKKDITVLCVDFCEVTTTKVHAVLQRRLATFFPATIRDSRKTKIPQKRQNQKTTKMKKNNRHYPTSCKYEGK